MSITDFVFPVTTIRTVASSRYAQAAALVALHLAALVSLDLTEYGLLGQALALLVWGILNFVWLLLLRRPTLAAALSLLMIELIIALSLFKFSILEMTLSFFDFLVIDSDSVHFLMTIFPALRVTTIAIAAVTIPALLLLWRIDMRRIRRRTSMAGAAGCFAGVVALSALAPEQPWEPFGGVNHVSNFARSGVLSVSELITHGWLEVDANVYGRLDMTAGGTCRPAHKPPHILMVLDESSFDITRAPNVKVPPGYRDHFRSFDGEARSLLVEATGGPTWYSEYNVLTGLSARSYGRFKFNVTRIAAGRVMRGLPHALSRCGYRTMSFYPAYGAFLSARRFQTTTGIERFVDLKEMGAKDDLQPDRFYFDHALRMIGQAGTRTPLFMFIYVSANHFPWTWTFRPDLTPEWRGLGNEPEIDEYIRRQTMSAKDYAAFVGRLQREFPNEPFLLVRFGDHQPALSTKILEPGLDAAAIGQRVMDDDPRYFTTYYAIDTINFMPTELNSARKTIEAAYLPLVIQEAAGLPLDPSFAEQKKIMQRCDGLFYRCADGAEVRRFNRLLIDAGLIKGL